MTAIRLAECTGDVQRCGPVMLELRPHLSPDEFLAQIHRQQSHDRYQLAFLEHEEQVRSVAGFRTGECLMWGRFMYVDDLVTREVDRSKGFGQQLFAWLVTHARSLNCQQFHLDSGVQRFGAHRFYLTHGMDITSHHFALRL
ncbi:MAG: GNAT family N-acetyltransferase [Planctomycetota bacterium]